VASFPGTSTHQEAGVVRIAEGRPRSRKFGLGEAKQAHRESSRSRQGPTAPGIVPGPVVFLEQYARTATTAGLSTLPVRLPAATKADVEATGLEIGRVRRRVTGVADLRLRVLPYAAEHAFRLFDLPSHHADPFDRQIIAQALVENVPIVTPDEAFNLYEGLKVVW
jgi:predicted nucleic acid-binding protein